METLPAVAEKKEKLELRPQEGPQTTFLSTSADVAIFGGSAGGGKSFSLLLEPLRHISNPGFNAVIFRRTLTQVMKQGALWDESGWMYKLAGGTPRENSLEWFFPSGSSLQFSHLKDEKTKYEWDGSQICLLCFDELQHFSEGQFFYMLSRNRSTCGVQPYARGTCNPDPDSWLALFLAWWIDQDQTLPTGEKNPRYGLPIPERAGVIRYFVRVGESIVWADTEEELLREHPELIPKSCTFIPSSIYDNKILLEKDPGYLANLMSQMPVEKARLLEGNWKIKHGVGMVFDRSWFGKAMAVPHGGTLCRFWDLAATEKEIGTRQREPDWTVGILMHRKGQIYTVVDMIDVRVGPAEIDSLMRNTAERDQQMADMMEARYMLRWEREPAGAAKRESKRMALSFDQYDADGVLSRKDKITRATPLATQARAGGVQILDAEWKERLLNHLHNQPDWPWDDMMDAASGAYNALSGALIAPEVTPGNIEKVSVWPTGPRIEVMTWPNGHLQ